MFGPDGRLYVLQINGTIDVFTIQRNGPNNYIVLASEEILAVKNIPNHNDDGSFNSGTNREATGITVVGTAANPVIYATSSDSRVGGPSGDLNLDTNSGVITRLTWNGSSWDVVDIVRGLPRSEENHATNGLEFVSVNGTDFLIVCSGGHTNAGAPSTNFAWTTEYALAAAILSVNLSIIASLPILQDGSRQYIYDIPTLDDPSRPNFNGITDPDTPGYNGIDMGDPWGGNDGLNQAMIVPGGPVQIFSPGYRNTYDLTVTQSGAVYATDNGANGGWGGLPENEGMSGTVTNNYIVGEPGSSSPVDGEQVNNVDHLTMITNNIGNYTFGSFYGGHPTPIRANPAGAGLYTNPSPNNTTGAIFRTLVYDPDGSRPNSTTDPNLGLPANWPPVPVSMANIAEGDWRGPGINNPDGPNDVLVTTWGTNTNGLDEYTASNFGGAMQGDLIAGVNGGILRRVQLNPDGSLLQLTSSFASGIGGNCLGITCNGDSDPFPGTIWVAPFNTAIVVLEPQDFVICILPGEPGYDPNGDNDSDGYTNQDEIDNGTDICNGGSQPNDHDKAAGGTLVSDLNDPDDDNDGILDANDVLQLGDPLDAASDAFSLPVINELFSDNPDLKGYLGLGFTGMMNNGAPNPNWLNWLDRRDNPMDPNPNDILGGAVGAMTMQMTGGTAKGAANSQEKGFQYGVKVDIASSAFTVSGRLLNFNDPLQLYSNPANGELGIFMGDGTQSNFIQVVLTKSGVSAVQEINDVPQTPLSVVIPPGDRPGVSATFSFNVNAVTGDVQVFYTFDNNPPVALGTIAAQGTILNAIQNSNAFLVVGLIGTSNSSNAEVEGTWDFLNVAGSQPTIVQVIPTIEKFVGDPAQVIQLDDYFGDDGGVANLTYTVEANTDPAIGAGISGSALTLTFPAATPATSNLTVRATDQGGLFIEQTFQVIVSDEPVVLFRVNAGGPLLATTDSPNPDWAANAVGGAQSGTGFSVNTGNISTHNITGRHSSVPAYAPQALFAQERWDLPAEPEMQWSFTTGNGNFIVNLYMGNGFAGTSAPGARVFNVSMEGALVVTNKDLSAQYGSQVGAMESYQVTVTDGVLNIEFIHVVENPLINAIEILGAGTGPGFGPIVVNPIANQTGSEGQIINLPVLASGGDPNENFSFAATGLPAGIQIEPTTGLIFGTLAIGAATGSPYNPVVTVSKPGSSSVNAGFTWNIGTASSLSSALVAVLPGNNNLNASTFSNGSFQITNTSPSANIISVTFDMTSGFLPNMVFDPNGTAGDVVAKGFTVNTNPGVGTLTHAYASPLGNGGFQQLDLTFTDFNPGELFTFSLDQDPTSIQGLPSPGPNESGSVNGLEQAGSTITVVFSDGSTFVATLYSDGSISGVSAVAKANLPAAPVLAVAGLTSPATTAVANHNIQITSGPANGTVSLLKVEAGFYQGGGNLNQEPFEVNKAISVVRQTGIQLNGSGAATLNVTLTDSDAEAGYNYFLAAVENGADFGLTSNPIVLYYDDQFVPPVSTVLYRVNAGGPLVPATDAPNPDWGGDTGTIDTAENSEYLVSTSPGTSIFSQTSGSAYQGPVNLSDPSLTGTNISTIPFTTERYDNNIADPPLAYSFPVAPGTYIVRLYFMELFTGITAAGQRVFDVSVEGSVPAVFTGIDCFARNGALGAFMLSHTLEVTDGSLDLQFVHGVENPAVKAIEILGTSSVTQPNSPPLVTNPGTQSGVDGNPVTLQVIANDPDNCGGLNFSATGLPPSLSINPATGLITGTLNAGSGSGTAGAFIESSGLVIIEAETDFADTPGGWNLETGTPTYLVASTNSFGNANGGQNLNYNVQITTPGVYRFHMKSVFSGTVSTDQNDSWFKINNTADVHFFCVQGGALTGTQEFLNELANSANTAKTLYYPAGNAMGRPNHGTENPGNSGYFKVYRSGGGGNAWNTNTIDNNNFPIYAYFPNAGTFTISMSERSAGHKVDRFALAQIDNVSTGVPTATLDGAQSQQSAGSVAGASANSPYSVSLTVSDNCQPSASTTVNFSWVVNATQPTGQASALVEITPGGALDASTFGGSSLQITNTSTGNVQITGVSIDLSTGILPDMVFDPVGTGGDATASCFTANSGAAAVGLIAPANPCTDPFSQPRNGGFDVMSIGFNNFDPSEQFFFTTDVDPNSIQGVPGAGGAGAVSGFELIGATITLTFSDGSTVVSSLYEDGSLGGGQAVVAANAPATPGIAAVGVSASAACVAAASQTIEVSGTPGANVSLLLMDSRLYIQSGAPPFNVPDPTFYANEAMAKALYTGVVGPGGTVEIPVTLLQTPGGSGTPNGGLNYIVAVLSNGAYAVDQQVSRTSNVLVLKVDPLCVPATANISLNVTLQGRTNHSGDYTVKLYPVGEAITPDYDLTGTADASGNMSLSNIAPGTYQVAVKRSGYLQMVETVILAIGENSLSVGPLLGGDVNNDNQVSLADFALLAGVFNTTNINPISPTNLSDINGNGITDLADFAILAGNYAKVGETPSTDE